MPTNRKVPVSTDPTWTGALYMDAVASKIGILFNNMTLIPTSITNTGNDYTMIVDPVLDADVTAGMAFYITPNTINTGATRIRVTTANPYYDLVKASGAALAAGDFDPANVYFCVFVGGKFKILSVSASAGGTFASVYFQEFLTSGTWNKPAGISGDALVFVEVWAGGGGGARNGTAANAPGAGGGQYRAFWFRASDLPSSVAITVGGGGAGGATAGSSGSAGGDSSFGTLISAFGGGAGVTAGSPGSGGGFRTGQASNGDWGQGGQGSLSPTFTPIAPNLSNNSIYGGAGGGGGAASGAAAPNAGTSVFGGAGAALGGANGSVPGGGGAGCTNAPGGTGGAGKVRVRVIG